MVDMLTKHICQGGAWGLQTHRAKYNIMSHECERGLLSPSSE